ncbi:hypothetical protein E3N88_31475 [Mikania micrantha]|uniref:Uncharacterized protein n=1 Tax=Mikania micrantha TaxID=192012 RepID=A0A5N6MPI9_9ASTR|nr:hypothetical protein E3N88_31475 [Mikania micrantha]
MPQTPNGPKFALKLAKAASLRPDLRIYKLQSQQSLNIGIEQAMDHHHPRMLKAVSMMKQHAKPSPAALNQKFDPFQSSKRPVRRGSDPIHNRS